MYLINHANMINFILIILTLTPTYAQYKGVKNPIDREFNGKPRDHISRALHLDSIEKLLNEDVTFKTLNKLADIYNNYVKPLEKAYKFSDMDGQSMLEGEIFALPKVLFIGPWSTGKSSLINYILGIENSSLSLVSGAQPTTSDFTILAYGAEAKSVDGHVLVMEKSHAAFEKYGQKFLERTKSFHIPNNILKLVNFVDTPGVIENRKQQQRGYPFSDICQWFINYSDLIILVFDPTKLDVGIELEHFFKQLKGSEAKVRIVLNKADTISSQELIRVYGTLFWSLSPLINVTEPPKVYIGSFWSKPFLSISKEHEMFHQEEISLFQDIYRVMSNRLENKISLLRQHAVMVRNHALLVDRYLTVLNQHRSIFQSSSEVSSMITNFPKDYKIYEKVLAHQDVSKRDLISEEDYRKFFLVHPLENFLPLSKHCGFLSSCLLDIIEYAIYEEIPALLMKISSEKEQVCYQDMSC